MKNAPGYGPRQRRQVQGVLGREFGSLKYSIYTLHGLKLDILWKGVLPHQYAEYSLFTNVQESAVQSICPQNSG